MSEVKKAMILDYLADGRHAATAEICQDLRLAPSTARRILNELYQDGLVRRGGSGTVDLPYVWRLPSVEADTQGQPKDFFDEIEEIAKKLAAGLMGTDPSEVQFERVECPPECDHGENKPAFIPAMATINGEASTAMATIHEDGSVRMDLNTFTALAHMAKIGKY